MGGITSSQCTGGSPQKQASAKKTLLEESDGTAHWQIWPSFEDAKLQYIRDPLMPPLISSSQVELRNLLYEPFAQKALGAFAKEKQLLHYLMCWIDIAEYKSTRSIDHKRMVGLKILHNYIKTGGPMHIKMAEEDIVHFKNVLKKRFQPLLPQNLQVGGEASVSMSVSASYYANGRPMERLESNLFDQLQKQIFIELYEKVFIAFKQKTSYVDLRCGLKKNFNKVRPKDFEYWECLGEGSFGVVVRCRKKSTGMYYAMKIIEKNALSDSVGWDRTKIDAEVRALSALRHPLIVSMDYSFQTPQLAMIVMQLVSGGTLLSILKQFDRQVLPERHIQFYVAEVVVALHYLHSAGMIYRDMKPPNVLIDLSGHIKLADLGGLSDYKEGTSLVPVSASVKSPGCRDGPSFPFARSYVMCETEIDVFEHLTKPVRRKTIFGTPGYASPEVMELLRPGRRLSKGYAYMTDWWSLGITIFVMCSGKLPFGRHRDADAMPADGDTGNMDTGYHDLFDPLVFGDNAGHHTPSADLQDLISKFLNVRDTDRLGTGLQGLQEIQTHPFFEGVDWVDITHMKAEPPALLYSSDTPSAPIDFDTVCKKYVYPEGEMPVGLPAEIEGFENW
jgi:serine/threonine protein kinase